MKKSLTAMLCPALFVLATTLALPAFAADDSATSQAGESSTSSMEILYGKLKADKKLVVAMNMHLTADEEKGFWPIYDAYQKDLDKLNERTIKVINDYALAYKKGAVLNATAKQLIDEAIAIDLAEAKLKQSYVPKLGKVLPALKVARYVQIENKIRAIVRFELADLIPLVE